MQKNVPDAIKEFEESREVQSWTPLLHFCAYELAFTHMFNRDWLAATQYWEELFKENEWSKGFYCYSKGVCYLAAGDEIKAEEMFELIPASVANSKKINGRPLPMDRFVKRKYETYIHDKKQSLVLPQMELVYVWNGFSQMDDTLLKTHLQFVEEWEKKELQGDHKHLDDAVALVHLLKGAIHSQLRNYSQAETSLNQVEELKKSVREEIWIVAYARYELAMLWYRMDKPEVERAIKKIKHAMGKKGDYNFDLQLDLRGHLALYKFNHYS